MKSENNYIKNNFFFLFFPIIIDFNLKDKIFYSFFKYRTKLNLFNNNV
jgi:hypothetical protein